MKQTPQTLEARKAHIREAIKASITNSRIYLVAIASASKTGIPSGHIYARVMGKLSLHEHQTILGTLERLGFITSAGHLLCITPEGTKAATIAREALEEPHR